MDNINPTTREEIDRAIADAENIAVVRGKRQIFNKNQANKKKLQMQRKSKVNFTLPTSKTESQSEDLLRKIPELNLQPEFQSSLVPPQKLSISTLYEYKPNLTKVDRIIQTDDCDLSEYVDHGLFEEIDPRQIKVGVARDINKKREVGRASRRSTFVGKGRFPRTRRASEWERVPNRKIARRNTKIPEKANRLRKATLFLGKLTDRLIPGGLGESESTSSSDWSSSEWSDLEQYSNEKDKSWIETSGTDYDFDEMLDDYERKMEKMKPKKVKSGKPDPDANIDPEVVKMMSILTPFLWLLKLMGRTPFETYIENRVIKFRMRKKSWPFIYFGITSMFLMFNTCMMAIGGALIIKQIGHNSSGFLLAPDPFHRQVERRLVDKYWYFTIVTFFYLVHASTWNLAMIFEEGSHLADYMTNINIALANFKYDPFECMLNKILLQQGWFIAYTLIICVLYIGDFVAAVRGTSDLIAVLIFLPWIDEVVFSQAYYVLQVYGLFVHLYAIYASFSIVLYVVTYAHVLENIAKNWNLRVAYVFGCLGRPEGEDRIVTYHSIIPYKKLFTEHRLITEFLRETGYVFNVGLGNYFVMKFCEMILVGYRAMSVVVFPIFESDQNIVPGLPSHLPEFRFSDPKGVIIMTSFYALFQCFGGWYMVSEWITECGDAIMFGYEFARRQGLVAGNAIQRRFILSLHNTYAPITDMYVRTTFTIRRSFTFDTFFWVCTFLSLLTAFSPLQLQTELVTVCSASGTCITVATRSVTYNVGRKKEELAVEHKVLLNLTEPTPTPPPFTTLSSVPAPPSLVTPTTNPTPSPLVTPTTNPTPSPLVITPITVPPPSPFPALEYNCSGTWNTISGATVALTITLQTGCNNSVVELTPTYRGISDGQCPEGANRDGPYKHFQEANIPVYSCISGALINQPMVTMDDCENIRFPLDTAGTFPRKTVVYVETFDPTRVLCCYDYQKPGQQLEFCNMPNKDVADHLCVWGLGGGILTLNWADFDADLKAHLDRSRPLSPLQKDRLDECLCEDPNGVPIPNPVYSKVSCAIP